MPPKALPKGAPDLGPDHPSTIGGVKIWSANCEACFGYWTRIKTDCAICMRVCPFNRRGTVAARIWRGLHPGAAATPPFRADHVGSLLRPTPIAEARKKRFEDKTMSAEELTEVEDAAIPALINMQEQAGLKAVTDGEARRMFWHYDFMEMLNGFELERRS